MYTFFLLYNVIAVVVFCKNLDIKAGFQEVVPSSIGLKFSTEMRNNGEDDLAVEVYPDECCLDNNDSQCDVLEIIGGATDVIDGGTTKTLIMVAPLLDQYERKGYCTIYIDSRPVSRPKNIVRDTVKIKFNTKSNNAKLCQNVDHDPLNDCKPVNCDTYYNDKRSHYSVTKRQCVNVPICISSNSKVPLTAYNPTSNTCVQKPSISEDDIKFIKEWSNGKNRISKDVILIQTNDALSTNSIPDITLYPYYTTEIVPRNYSYDHRDNELAKNPVTNTAIDISKARCKIAEAAKSKVKAGHEKFSQLFEYLSENRNSVMVLALIIFLQCCMIFALIYFMVRKCACRKKKNIINKYFNYRQDASVTTPLIGTSNMDTETTEYQYLSESSNYIDKKIKCYKACQKERKNNVKLSMSDDILSKCLTRRDWQRVPRSEAIPEINSDDLKMKKEVIETKKQTETKVNFQEEHLEKKSKANKSGITKENKHYGEILGDFSEKEICCHSYNYDCFPNKTSMKKNSQGKTVDVFNNEKQETNSIEKGAQACFSNDSIDDFLSERGVIFIGDNASKYSFSSLSSNNSSVGSQSSKTSKNNIVKNVISLLSRKSKGPSSDPGVKKSKADLDLELLHISRASVFSSSNDTDGGKDLKRVKESTSSL